MHEGSNDSEVSLVSNAHMFMFNEEYLEVPYKRIPAYTTLICLLMMRFSLHLPLCFAYT